MGWVMEILKICLEQLLIKILPDKAFNIAKNRKHDGHQRDLASMAYKYFDKNSSASRTQSKIRGK